MLPILVVDSGSTKAEWVLVSDKSKRAVHTEGISPYFLSEAKITEIISKKVLPKIKDSIPAEIYFYGTGCKDLSNSRMIKKAIKNVFSNSRIEVNHDLLGAARALCGTEKAIACILGTGANSCYFDGKKIIKNSPGLGYVLGDEGSGSYLGKKVIQYYLYKTFDADLMDRFNLKYNTNADEILASVYKQPLPNKYLANFTMFLSENRGHFMIENIIEDGLNDFFFTHIYKYSESWKLPIHFTGSVAFGFKDVVNELCKAHELQLGSIFKKPIDGLIKYHLPK